MTTKKTGNDDNAFYAQVVAVLEKHNGMAAAQHRRDTEAMINAAVTKAVQREVAGAIKEIFGAPSKDGSMQMVNDKTVADAIMHGVVTSALLRSVYGLVPNLLKR